jgi:Sec-independent protein translocase protein TatA
MFDFGWSELLVVGIVALVFIGPNKLAEWTSKIRHF